MRESVLRKISPRSPRIKDVAHSWRAQCILGQVRCGHNTWCLRGGGLEVLEIFEHVQNLRSAVVGKLDRSAFVVDS